MRAQGRRAECHRTAEAGQDAVAALSRESSEQPLWGHTPSPDVSNEMNTACCPQIPLPPAIPGASARHHGAREPLTCSLLISARDTASTAAGALPPFPFFPACFLGACKKRVKHKSYEHSSGSCAAQCPQPSCTAYLLPWRGETGAAFCPGPGSGPRPRPLPKARPTEGRPKHSATNASLSTEPQVPPGIAPTTRPRPAPVPRPPTPGSGRQAEGRSPRSPATPSPAPHHGGDSSCAVSQATLGQISRELRGSRHAP